jgi:hypothetical protein
MRAPKRRLALVLAALSLTGAAAFAAEPDDETMSDPPSGTQPPVQAADPEQRGSFGILRRAASTSDRLPSAVSASIGRSLTGDVGAATALARRAIARAGGDSVYVLPGRGWLCYYVVTGDDTGYGSCNRTGEAMKGRLVGMLNPAPGITRITGLVPDSVREVILRGSDGAVERMAPEGNVYMFDTTMSPKQVEWGSNVVPVSSPAEDHG